MKDKNGGEKKVKNLLATVCLIVGFCKCVVWSAPDRFGSLRPAIWRSSRTASPDTNVRIASTSIHFHSIAMSSPSPVGSGGAVLIFDATDFTLPNLSTQAIISTDAGEAEKHYDILLSTGLLYRKSGGADVNILWDYLTYPPGSIR